MITIHSSAHLRENATRQAKRLKNLLDLSLTTAKEVLAKGPYRCSNWGDLCARLDAANPEDHTFLLASLPGPNASKSYFSKNIRQIARSLSQHILTNTNLAGLYQTLRNVFGISDEQVTLADIACSIKPMAWQSANIGPDSHAVIYAFASINGVPIKLIATRVYLPELFKFGPEITCSGKLAEPIGEPLMIMWSNPRAWYEAAYTYLTAPEDEENLELNLPNDTLDEAMERHKQWFMHALEIWHQESIYSDDGEEFVSYVGSEGCYLIFGLPCTQNVESGCPEVSKIFLPADVENDSEVILIDDQPLCIEWISVDRKSRTHDGDFREYFEDLRGRVFSHEDCDLDLFYLNGWDTSFFFIRPASQFDIKQFLKVDFHPEAGEEVFVLKTDHPSIASTIFEMVAAREVMMYSSMAGYTNYVIETDVSRLHDIRSFSLSLDILGQEWQGGYNLSTTSIVSQESGRKTLYLSLEPRLFSLVDLVGKKSLKEAVQHGLVLHRPAGFGDILGHAPKWSGGLAPAPQELIDTFERPLWEEGIPPFELFRHARSTQYKRDNY